MVFGILYFTFSISRLASTKMVLYQVPKYQGKALKTTQIFSISLLPRKKYACVVLLDVTIWFISISCHFSFSYPEILAWSVRTETTRKIDKWHPHRAKRRRAYLWLWKSNPQNVLEMIWNGHWPLRFLNSHSTLPLQSWMFSQWESIEAFLSQALAGK